MEHEQHIWVEIENEDQVMLGLDIYHAAMQVRTKGLLAELAQDGVTFLEKNAPNYTSYTIRHIDKEPVVGERGDYETTVGVKRGTSYHPVYANVGTGIFGPWIKQPYTAHNPSGLMWFYSHIYGRVIGVRSVKGQRAQHFLYTTFRELQVFAQARITLGAY